MAALRQFGMVLPQVWQWRHREDNIMPLGASKVGLFGAAGLGGFVEASGGTETTSGDYKIHTFTGDGTFTVTRGGEVVFLVVAGGGGAGSATPTVYGGGGGGGG